MRRGTLYTEYSTFMRCAKQDHTTATMTLHYLANGGMRLRVRIMKQDVFIPLVLILRALLPKITDCDVYYHIANRVSLSSSMRSFFEPCRKADLSTIAQLGATVRNASSVFSEVESLESIGQLYLDHFVAVHVPQFPRKYHSLVIMARKLVQIVRGACSEDSSDSFGHQELLLPGQIISALLLEQIAHAVEKISTQISLDLQLDAGAPFHSISAGFESCFMKLIGRYAGTIGEKVKYFLSTGNLVSPSGLDLQQTAGFVVTADRLNAWRFCSHFRSVHRGHFYTTMKTTAVRKLLPEAWGFLCPVHTPDGAPCGLLSHLSSRVRLNSYAHSISGSLVRTLLVIAVSLGMFPYTDGHTARSSFKSVTCSSMMCDLPILLDGIVMGVASRSQCRHIVLVLRNIKCLFRSQTSSSIEIAHFDCCSHHLKSPFEAVYVFSTCGRVCRPVTKLSPRRCIELLGPFEQLTTQISYTHVQVHECKSGSQSMPSYAEINPSFILSALASFTPFSELNQSPRNMYQCQMGKQTMGVPAYSLHHRCDNKLYHLLTPQAPLVATSDYWRYELDRFAQGCNSVVAVVSYSGYDMEDAMVVKRSSFDRGFGRGAMYKTLLVDLNLCRRAKTSMSTPHSNSAIIFGRSKRFSRHPHSSFSRKSGLPEIGHQLRAGDVLWYAVDSLGEEVVGFYNDEETAYVDAVRIIGEPHTCEKAVITFRYVRNPTIGDKFSSRHGQKGVLSLLPEEADMPFTESGFSPDLIINPHAFPSRMTIGMIIESVAGKSASLHGCFVDSSAFGFSEWPQAALYFGNGLLEAGYSHHGCDPVYSGVSGCPLHLDIFTGIVYYQRLRHMIADKSQVRATGPVHKVTMQPVKGRKRHGGIRLGEMERDALIAHGLSFSLRDRLLDCSDRVLAHLCPNPKCACPFSSSALVHTTASDGDSRPISMKCSEVCCRWCLGMDVRTVVVPYICRYLANELAGMNVKVAFLPGEK
mmetsp:Transcript_24202/g.74642  ORF Transcript_24202/g.74642 Transcript_24202/m.74642 type:complete len:979 (-) Transcript_24202:1006-3942(-)